MCFTHDQLYFTFWATVCKTVCPMLSDHCPVCNVGVLWPNGWTDQDETWNRGRPRPRSHCVKWGPAPQRRTAPSIFGPCLLWLNGCMDQDATWYGGTPRPRPHCIRWEPSSPQTKTPQQSIIQYTNKLLVYWLLWVHTMNILFSSYGALILCFGWSQLQK